MGVKRREEPPEEGGGRFQQADERSPQPDPRARRRSSSSPCEIGRTRKSGAGPSRSLGSGRRCSSTIRLRSRYGWSKHQPSMPGWRESWDKKPPGVINVDDYWANLQAMTDPSLKPEVFLASREKQVEELGDWLNGPPGAMVIQARSPAEGIDFVVAAYNQDPSQAERFGSRALIVERRDAWRDVSAADRRRAASHCPPLPVDRA